MKIDWQADIPNMQIFKEKMMPKLGVFLDVDRLILAEDDEWSALIDSKNDLCFYVYPGELLLTFSTEHTHYYAFDYENGDQWLDIFCEDLKFLLSHPIKYERVYHGKTETKTKLYCQSSDGKWKLYRNTMISMNVFARIFNKKQITSEIIEFKQQ